MEEGGVSFGQKSAFPDVFAELDLSDEEAEEVKEVKEVSEAEKDKEEGKGDGKGKEEEEEEEKKRPKKRSGGAGFDWEERERTWQSIEENENGMLNVSSMETIVRRKKIFEDDGRLFRRGMVRSVVLILDVSSSSLSRDFFPTRLIVFKRAAKAFVNTFFDQNALSQLGILFTKDEGSVRCCGMSGDATGPIASLDEKIDAGGEPSVQNTLEHALNMLESSPGYGSREIVLVMSSLRSLDPSNVFLTIRKLKKAHIRVFVVGLLAEVFLFRHIASETGGRYDVAADEGALWNMLHAHAYPSPQPADYVPPAALVPMAFPVKRTVESKKGATLCACHRKPTRIGYECPRCQAKMCSIPAHCAVCMLRLVPSPHMARTYHHLFPVRDFMDVPLSELKVEERKCFGCLSMLKNDGKTMGFRCPVCSRVFCVDCDIFIHDHLHTCPGCGHIHSNKHL
eukprot:TRINITY_DN3889_c1_g5_i1.p1 TRINITY_DN3889_c1_g5~~TRINITY_DN3889_c1_g5_i1.p1  ORF type:complete len:480 (-),score=120.89 TRINITY_DN3889_c1_g5_i1:102-1460(-)